MNSLFDVKEGHKSYFFIFMFKNMLSLIQIIVYSKELSVNFMCLKDFLYSNSPISTNKKAGL